jgi:hypothetical protein
VRPQDGRFVRSTPFCQVSNILRAILMLLSVFVLTATAHAVEATAQEFLVSTNMETLPSGRHS